MANRREKYWRWDCRYAGRCRLLVSMDVSSSCLVKMTNKRPQLWGRAEDMTPKFDWWALGIGIEAALLGLVPMTLALAFLPITIFSIASEFGTLFALIAMVTVWSLVQYWVLAVATAKRHPYRFDAAFWLAAIGSLVLMVSLGKGGLFGLPAAVGAAHFSLVQLLWRRRRRSDVVRRS